MAKTYNIVNVIGDDQFTYQLYNNLSPSIEGNSTVSTVLEAADNLVLVAQWEVTGNAAASQLFDIEFSGMSGGTITFSYQATSANAKASFNYTGPTGTTALFVSTPTYNGVFQFYRDPDLGTNRYRLFKDGVESSFLSINAGISGFPTSYVVNIGTGSANIINVVLGT